MNKKVISLVLALVMVLGTFTSVFATGKTEEPAKKDAKVEETKKEAPKAGEKVEKIVGKDNKIQYIVDKKFVKGYEDGSMGYDKNITRAEITRLLVLANGNEELANSLQGAMKLYTDVDTKHWANGVISVGTTRPSDANKIAMLAGYPDKSFKPDQNVTYAELAKMLVVLVKKDLTEDMVKNAKWATSWLLWAKELGILEDVDVKDSNAFATRADAFTMVYNALFAMKEFKQVPNNEVRGILSDLNNNKLQLNQDTKKEYKITEKTVLVNSIERNRSNTVLVSLMRNQAYYLGSLVRVLVNDKDEVTHILVLGDPKQMAVDAGEGKTEPNSIWKGVAKNTAETAPYDLGTLVGKDTSNIGSYVKIGFNSDKTSAKTINFYFSKNTTSKNISLAINDSTEVYVANPYNNIMKKVSGINEALSLIGFQNYNGYRIPNVYAGYDSTSLNPTYREINVGSDRHTAKVIVFNVVSKEQGGDLYRVINTTRSNYVTTVENTDGKRFERDNSTNTFGFPFNYDGDLYDVIEVFGWRSNQRAEIKIDHSDVKNYPVVKVVYANSDELRVVDRYNDYTTLDIRKADIFTKLNKLGKDSVIQFSVENKNSNVAEIVSILPKDTALEGSIKGVLPMINAKQRVGKIIEVRPVDGLYSNVVIDVERDLLDADAMSGPQVFRVNKAVADKLATFARKADMFAFKVDYVYTDKGVQIAYDFIYNDGVNKNKPVEAATATDAVLAYTKAVDAYNARKADTTKPLSEANYKEFQELLDAVTEAMGNLTKSDIEKLPVKYLDVNKENPAFNATVEQTAINTPKANAEARAALKEAIKGAKALVDSVKASVDGKDVASPNRWATQADINTFNTAIAAAETAAKDMSKAKAALDSDKTTLQTAQTTFDGQAKVGTKTN